MASLQTKLTDEDGIAREAFMRLARATDEFEGYAHPHAERIADLCSELAKMFGLGRADRASLRLAALAHDLGELTMKRDYIRRAAPLDFDERLDLARHPVIGEQEAARAGADRGAQLLVRWHHEWWNGTGYPDALRREQIPLAARILRVADAYAALTDARPFRPALTEEAARRHLAQWAGLEFDPNIVRAFLSLSNLPALRSYALRDEDTATVKTALPEASPNMLMGDSATGDVEVPHNGGYIPEMEMNPYIQRVEANAQDAPFDNIQGSAVQGSAAQSSAREQDSASLTKFDNDRHV